MSKKWNDPDARDNYVLLITLDNIIIFFISMYFNYSFATNFLSGKFLKYSIYDLKELFIIRFICILICSYNASKILFSMVEMYHEYDKPYRDFDNYKFKNKFSYYQFFKAINISSMEVRKKQCIRIALYSILWIVITIVLSMQNFASYGTKNSIQQVMSLREIDYDIQNNNIVEYDIINPTIHTSSNGLHFIISDYNQYDTELVLTNWQYNLLKNDKNSSYRIVYYGSSGFVVTIEKITTHTEVKR